MGSSIDGNLFDHGAFGEACIHEQIAESRSWIRGGRRAARGRPGGRRLGRGGFGHDAGQHNASDA